MTATDPLRYQLDRIQRGSLLVGAAGGALLVIGAFLDSEQFFRSYLLGYLFWIGIALGSLAIVMLHHLTGGGWGFIIRRTLETAAQTLPFMALLFLPILLGLEDLYSWARPEEVARDEILRHKIPYLNVPFFLLRSGFYFALWSGVALLLNRWSRAEDRARNPSLQRRFRFLSGPGLVLYGGTVTFAAVDWVMSLDAHWFSTIYGVMFIVGQILTTLAFVIIVTALLANYEPLSKVISPSHFHDLGNLMLAFVVLWAYIAFSQFLIIWSGNLPEGVPWYLHRTKGGWEWLALFLILFHFALPLFLLLSRRTKRSVQMLGAVAGGMIVMRLVDLLWVVAPSFHHDHIAVHWLDLMAPIGVGGIWIAVFIWLLKGKSLLPFNDPYFEETMRHD